MDPEIICPICGTKVQILEEEEETWLCRCPKCRAKFFTRKDTLKEKELKTFNPSER